MAWLVLRAGPVAMSGSWPEERKASRQERPACWIALAWEGVSRASLKCLSQSSWGMVPRMLINSPATGSRCGVRRGW
eukprot:2468337-Rhodomonas_salina.1